MTARYTTTLSRDTFKFFGVFLLLNCCSSLVAVLLVVKRILYTEALFLVFGDTTLAKRLALAVSVLFVSVTQCFATSHPPFRDNNTYERCSLFAVTEVRKIYLEERIRTAGG